MACRLTNGEYLIRVHVLYRNKARDRNPAPISSEGGEMPVKKAKTR
jgi:hypothetical protein